MSKLVEERQLADSMDLTCYPRCLVIVPTRELAVQIHSEAKKFADGVPGLVIKSVYGGTSVDFSKRELSKVCQLFLQ